MSALVADVDIDRAPRHLTNPPPPIRAFLGASVKQATLMEGSGLVNFNPSPFNQEFLHEALRSSSLGFPQPGYGPRATAETRS